MEEWWDKVLLGRENALGSRLRSEEALRDEEIKRLKQKLGTPVLDLSTFKEVAKPRPTEPGTFEP